MSEVDSIPELRSLATLNLPGYYVSADGRVWSTKRVIYPNGRKFPVTVFDGPVKELKQQITNQVPGYMVVTLTDTNRKQRICLVHRLVLTLFVGPCPEGMECRHLDGNAKNNNVANLQWATHLVNSLDMALHGTQAHLRGELNGYHKLEDDDIRDIRKRYAAGGVTQKALAEEYETTKSNIAHIIHRRTWWHI